MDRESPPPGEGGPRRQRGLTLALAALGTAIVVGVGVLAVRDGGGTGDGGGDAQARGSTSPTAFELPALDGEGRVRLVDFRGRPTVVNFFASWCSSCDFELPGFAKISRELEGKVSFVGVDSLETGDPDYMPERHGITWWPLARDIGGANRSGLHDALARGTGMPITAFYDANGRLLTVDRGALPESTLRDRLRQLYGI